MILEKFFYPIHPLRCIICGPSSSGKSVILTKLLLNIINEYKKVCNFSPSLHQDLYQKSINCFTKHIPINIIPNILNEKDTDLVIDEIVNNRDFEKSDSEKQTYESIEELKFPQEYEDGGNIIVDELFEKEMKDR